MLKADIDRDLKTAMLARDKRLVSILRSLKSAILYKEVADGKRDKGLNDEEVVAVLKKERKSRLDASGLYHKEGEDERAEEEDYQISVIDEYLPEAISESETKALIVSAMSDLDIDKPEMKYMGQIMKYLKAKNSSVDGAVVSKIIKGLM